MPTPELVERVALALIQADGGTPHQKAKAALKAHEEWLAEQEMAASSEQHQCVYTEFVRTETRDNQEFTVVKCAQCSNELAFQSLIHARPTEDT